MSFVLSCSPHLLCTGIGAAYGTAKSGIGIAGVGTFRPDLIMKCLIPVIMSGIIAVYSLVVAVLIAGDMQPPSVQHYSLFKYVYAPTRPTRITRLQANTGRRI